MPQCLLVPDLAQLLATQFLILQHSITSTANGRLAEQIKNGLAINDIVQKYTRIIAKYYNLCNTS